MLGLMNPLRVATGIAMLGAKEKIDHALSVQHELLIRSIEKNWPKSITVFFPIYRSLSIMHVFILTYLRTYVLFRGFRL